jgi:hypothetical protein
VLIAEENFMLVTFGCGIYSDITMFGDVAQRLLNLMGHTGTVPGAILAADIPLALDRLKSAIEAETSAPNPDMSKGSQHEDSDERAVSLRHRALPLIELLAAAAKENCNVMWK